MQIENGLVFQDGAFTRGDVVIEGDRVADVRLRDGEKPQPGASSPDGGVACEGAQPFVDAAGCYVGPGFIDFHFHGCLGSDFCDGTLDAVRTLARYEASRGVTAICPATMTFPEEKLASVMDAAAAFAPGEGEAALVGINMEGPFISPRKVGAQNPAYVQPCDAAMVRRLQERSGGLVKLVDVAPEEQGALDFIREMAGEVRISLAHTCADYDTASAAYAAGARQATHLCNAMPPLHHREPGVIGAAYDSGDACVELICDGVHVHPSMARIVFGLFGDSRVILISDTMEAAGLTDGEYELGGQAVTVKGNRATLHDGTIAGSVTDLAACVQIAVCDMGIPLESAIRAATENPARALGLFDCRGSIASGKVADIVVLDEQLNVRDVIVRGRLI